MSLATVFGATSMSSRTFSTTSLSEASSSLSSRGQRIPFPKSDIEIHITNHYKTKTYTSSSPISGSVTITTQRDVRFDSIEIILLGGSKTRTEGYSAPHESTHTFLKLIMPIPKSTYPVPRVLENGTTITIPFHFVLPTFLTLSACHHKVDCEHVREQHLRLPPSMGSWTRGNCEKDDLAPHMSDVNYSIKARVWRDPELGGAPARVMEAVKPIQVMPASTIDAPVPVGPADTLYTTARAKTLRKNMLATKLGILTVSAQQPRAIVLRPDGRVVADSTAQLDLHYAPAGSGSPKPPRITAVAAKITAHTYYSAGPVATLPNTGDFIRATLAERRGVYSTSVSLLAAATDGPLEQPRWDMHRLCRRDSGYGSDGTADDHAPQAPKPPPSKPHRRKSSLANLIRGSRRAASPSPSPSPSCESSSSSSSSTVLTASIPVPLTLPASRRIFVPTFHSCIVSRVYTLRVWLTVDNAAAGAASAAGTGGPATKISLDLPMQIAVGGDDREGGQEQLPSWAEAVEAAAVDAFLQPRVLNVLAVPEEPGREAEGALPVYERRI